MKRMMLVACVALSMAVVCGKDSSAPESVVGTYTATRFVATIDGTETDELAAGATLSIALDVDLMTTGTLFVPHGNDDGSDLIANLDGTWARTGNTVTFTQTADTFVRDMPFTVVGSTLVGDRTFGTIRIQLTLTRSG